MISNMLKFQLKAYILTHFHDEKKEVIATSNYDPSSICNCELPEISDKYLNKIIKDDENTALNEIDIKSSMEDLFGIDDFIELVKDKQTFSEYLFSLIDESGETDADVYNRAGIDRRLFSKIRSKKDYQPSKNTIFALAMSLKLDYTKTSKLLNKAGYDFSNNKLTDVIIMFCIENKIYDLYQIDSFLVEYEQKPLASEV